MCIRDRHWFTTYLHGRSQYVRRRMMKSVVTMLVCGVRQGSVLGPILFLLYTADLIALVERHGFCPHLYADDSQVYGSCRPSAIADFQLRLSACIDDTASWMRANRLQLNISKRICSGVLSHVGNTSYRLLRWGSVTTSSAHRPAYATSTFILMPTWACGNMFSGL